MSQINSSQPLFSVQSIQMGDSAPKSLQGSFQLPNGKTLNISLNSVTVRNNNTSSFIGKFFSTLRRLHESRSSHHFQFEGKEVKVSKKEMSRAVAKQLLEGTKVQDAFEKGGDSQKIAQKKAQNVQDIFEKNATEWIQHASSLEKGTSTTFRSGTMKFAVMKKDTGEIDIQLKGKTLGEGSFKTAKASFSLLHNVQEAKTQPRKSLEGEDRKQAVNDIKKEYNISRVCQKNKIPFTMQLHQVRNPKTGKIANFGEMCDKGELGGILSNRKVPFSQKVGLLKDTAKGLAHFHKAGLCHLDIKPENIFVKTNEEGKLEPRIGDFGFAEKIGATKDSTFGTPFYVAPEMLHNNDKAAYSGAMDVFSFGVMLFDAIKSKTSPPLFNVDLDRGQFQQLDPRAHQNVQQQFRKQPQNAYKELIADCVQLDPSKRPTMEEVYNRLNFIQKTLENR